MYDPTPLTVRWLTLLQNSKFIRRLAHLEFSDYASFSGKATIQSVDITVGVDFARNGKNRVYGYRNLVEGDV